MPKKSLATELKAMGKLTKQIDARIAGIPAHIHPEHRHASMVNHLSQSLEHFKDSLKYEIYRCGEYDNIHKKFAKRSCAKQHSQDATHGGMGAGSKGKGANPCTTPGIVKALRAGAKEPGSSMKRRVP